MDSNDEAYILLLLSDGNLPTGAFVASAGLESFVTHGFMTPSGVTPGRKKDKLEYTIEFIRDNLTSYARTASPFVSDAHVLVQEEVALAAASGFEGSMADTMLRLQALDGLYEATTLNHVTRRASKTQGVALLSLYSKGFTKPSVVRRTEDARENDIDIRLGSLVDEFKVAIRREETHGHLPICWGVLTAALGLSIERSQFLHLFLCARGILSAGVRMNIIGPYAAQQLLLHAVKPLVTEEAKRCGTLRTGLKRRSENKDIDSDPFDGDILTYNGPASTWPLGEILGARHDLQHSRVFNS
ncbi:uncharacterized protein PHACADRAFT_86419 [Phanerochaete carnosa HHB-10118-sp]|uniref:Urease accessory protein UreF n=1 Tax=Phanerochaete carnosa (strain HHB-10118-sp) TaxID=650164 RepID=K5X8R2_PHACS|nr:uncharacterized protein PHACADRAFT_86419 [Phanerochaete carnosa HHB-10118-sp]EKM59272.1 hypothetical protein PHACADRAFT_86419 [Phanerochaete carnosa HHB-10118-sp]